MNLLFESALLRLETYFRGTHNFVHSRVDHNFYRLQNVIEISVTPLVVSEVARTRLREPGTKYNKFWQTLFLTRREEGYRGLYRGLWTHLMRQLPSTAIIWGTYEIVSTTLNRWQLQSAKSAKQLSYDLRDAANDSCQKTPVRN